MAIVEDFETIATEIIKEAAAYAGATEPNEAIASAIRQIRTVASAVLNALDSATAAQRGRMGFGPPMPPVEPVGIGAPPPPISPLARH